MKGLSVDPSKSEHGRIVFNASDMSELLAHAFSLVFALLRVLLFLPSTRVLLVSWMILLCLLRCC